MASPRVEVPPKGATYVSVDSPNGNGGGSPPSRRRSLKEQEVLTDGWKPYFQKTFDGLIMSGPLNLLLVCCPLAFYGHAAGYSEAFVFITSLLAIAPFAERLSFVTEQLAMDTSEVLGGLLNASFGNVTELIVSIFAMKDGLLRIVQVSLLGSILSNLLLVLGCAFWVGGWKYKEQRFNLHGSVVSSGLLLISVMSLAFPMLLDMTHEELSPDSSLMVSRTTSLTLLVVYFAYLYFQLISHSHLFEDEEDGEVDEDEEKILGAWGAVFWLAVITVFIAYLSEFMVAAIRGAATDLALPDLFLGTIIIPIVGNAAEHAAAVIFAYKNKMELALGIAVGSATQIALFVLPACVCIAWVFHIPLSMDFHPFETVVLLLSVLLVCVLISSGHSNWLQGLMLVVAYFTVATASFVHVDLTDNFPPPPPSPPSPPELDWFPLRRT